MELRLSSLVGLFGCFVARAITCGSVYCSGVYYDHIRIGLEISHIKTSTIFSLTIGVFFISGVGIPCLLRVCSERGVVMCGGAVSSLAVLLSFFTYNYHLFLLLFAIVNGFAQGLVFITVPVAGSFLFPGKYHHVVIGFLSCGDGIGLIVFPILFNHLIQTYSWRGSIFLYSGILLNLCVCGVLLNSEEIRVNKDKAIVESNKIEGKHTQEIEETKNEDGRFRKWKKMFSDPRLIFLLSSSLLSQVSITIFFTFIYALLISEGFSDVKAASVMTVIGLSSMITRLGTMVLDNRPWLRRWVIYLSAQLIIGAMIILIPLIPMLGGSYEVIVLLAFVLGMCCGTIGSLVCCVGMDILGPERLADTFSLMMGCWGFGSVAGTSVAGALLDKFQVYVVPLCAGAVFVIMAGILLLPLGCMKKYYETTDAMRIEGNWSDESQILANETGNTVKETFIIAKLRHISQSLTVINSTPHKTIGLSLTDRIKGSIMEMYGGPSYSDLLGETGRKHNSTLHPLLFHTRKHFYATSSRTIAVEDSY